MELRKKINPPKRLDDEIAEKADDAERVPPAKALSGQAYCGNITQHNPNLGPAAFPTLDPRRIALHHSHQRRALVPSSSHSSLSTPVPSHQNPINETVTAVETGLTGNFHQMRPQQSHTYSQERKAAPHTDNGPGNPIWEANMKLMEKLGSMTEEEEFMAEMETSDEEDAPTQPRVKPFNSARCHNWGHIALRLQIDMITSVVGEDGDAVVAYTRLRLTQDQQDVITVKLHELKEREAAEDAAIAAHQQKCHQGLLMGRKFGQEKFRSILSEHLYKDLKGDNMIVTRGNVKLAQAYLLYCGLDPSVLNDWVGDDDEDKDDIPLVFDEDEMKRKHPGIPTVEEAEQMYHRLPWDTEEFATAANEAQSMDETDGAGPVFKEQSTQSRSRPSVPPIIISNPQQSQPVQPPFALKSAVNISPSTRTVIDTSTPRGSVSTNGHSPPALEQPNTNEKSPNFSEEPTLQADILADPATSPFGAEGFAYSVPSTPTSVTQGYSRSPAMQQAAPTERTGNPPGLTPWSPYSTFNTGNVPGGDDRGSNDKQTALPPTHASNLGVPSIGEDARRGETHHLVPATRALSVIDLARGENTETAVMTTEVKPKKKAGRRKKVNAPLEASGGK
ncbi:MAG: hypothetical protein Q9194_003306 [Teloschistes cf. exilis]